MNQQQSMFKTILIAGYPFPYTCSDEEWTAPIIDRLYFEVKYGERQLQILHLKGLGIEVEDKENPTDSIPPLEWYPLNMMGYSNYSISKDGRVLLNKRYRILNGGTNHNGDLTVQLTHPLTKQKSKHQVRRLVAFMFLEKPLLPHALAINLDENKLNNHVSNILWMYSPVQTVKGKMRKPVTISRLKINTWRETNNSTREFVTCFSVDDVVAFLGVDNDVDAKKKIKYCCKNLASVYGFNFCFTIPSLECEIWQTLQQPGYETICVSNKGRIKTQKGYIGYGTCTVNGYWVYHLRLKHKPSVAALFRVDELVILAFYSNKQIQTMKSSCCCGVNNPSSIEQIIHIDENTKNNGLFNLGFCKQHASQITRGLAGKALYLALLHQRNALHTQKLGPHDLNKLLITYQLTNETL